MKKYLLLFLFIPSLILAAKNTNIKVIPFVENQVVTLNASTFTVTQIQFGDDEKIQSVQNGDIAAWTVDVGNVVSNTLFIKPTVVGSNTNMTVITDRHTYYFHLISESGKQAPLYALKFHYPASTVNPVDLSDAHLPLDYHWDYSFHGSSEIMPVQVFDDGRFTYFQFQPRQVVSAIFAVDDKKGSESVVNFRREGHYFVVHRLSPQFTLRSGNSHVASVFNNRMIRMYQFER